jgi:hypothetical protein
VTQEHITRLLKVRHYSTAKMEKLGWKAKYSTKEALEKVIAELS